MTGRLRVPALVSRTFISLALVSLAGCSGSPAFNIVGSYFPAWLIALVAGVVVTLVVRQLLVMADLEGSLLIPPLTYAGMAVGSTLLIWLLFFGG